MMKKIILLSLFSLCFLPFSRAEEKTGSESKSETPAPFDLLIRLKSKSGILRVTAEKEYDIDNKKSVMWDFRKITADGLFGFLEGMNATPYTDLVGKVYLKSPSDESVNIYVCFGSLEDPSTPSGLMPEKSYFLKKITLSPGWNDIMVPLGSFSKIRNPLGWKKLHNIFISSTWEENEFMPSGTVIYFSSFRLE